MVLGGGDIEVSDVVVKVPDVSKLITVPTLLVESDVEVPNMMVNLL